MIFSKTSATDFLYERKGSAMALNLLNKRYTHIYIVVVYIPNHFRQFKLNIKCRSIYLVTEIDNCPYIVDFLTKRSLLHF